MRTIRIAAALVAGNLGFLGAAPALADDTDPPGPISLSGSIGVVSDYRFRGLSMNGGTVAVQGSLQADTSSGFYAGVWGSSLKQDPLDIFGTSEFDFYAGWTGEVASGWTADLGLTWYTYPGGSVGSANYLEPYASLKGSVGPVTAKAGINYAWSQDALGGDDNVYLYGEVESGVPGTPLTATAHLGYTSGALSPNRLTLTSMGGGFDYSIGASANVAKNLSVGVTLIGVDGNSIKGLSDNTVVGSLKFAF